MNQKKLAGEKAAEYIKDGMIIGLGTGSTAYYLIKKVGELVKCGMSLKAVATSKATEKLAKEFNIPLVGIDEIDRIDLAIDGVDEIDLEFKAIKGGGGALFREKMVATLANKVIWIMDNSKLVEHIEVFPLPVEILPYGHTQILRRLKEYSLNPVLRMCNDEIFVTDNGNYIIDLHIGTKTDIQEVSDKLIKITGVLEVGLFNNMCNSIIVGTEFGVRIVKNNNKDI